MHVIVNYINIIQTQELIDKGSCGYLGILYKNIFQAVTFLSKVSFDPLKVEICKIIRNYL